jgi:hypothetical protein
MLGIVYKYTLMMNRAVIHTFRPDILVLIVRRALSVVNSWKRVTACLQSCYSGYGVVRCEVGASR